MLKISKILIAPFLSYSIFLRGLFFYAAPCMLPLLCHRLRVFEEICCRIIRFVRKAATLSVYALIRIVVGYSVLYGWNNSYLWQNLLFFVRRFSSFSVDILVKLKFIESLTIVNKKRSVKMLHECILIREGQSVDFTCGVLWCCKCQFFVYRLIFLYVCVCFCAFSFFRLHFMYDLTVVIIIIITSTQRA